MTAATQTFPPPRAYATSATPRDVATRAAERAGIGLLGIALLDGERSLTIDHVGDTTASRALKARAPIYHAASTGKHVTARVILDLAATGMLSLDAAIGGYLPGLPPAWQARPVRSLLHHVSGLPDYPIALGEGSTPETADDFMALCASLPDGVPDASGWHYANTNYILLGLIAGAVTGETGGRLMQRLLDGAGASDARLCTPDWARAANAGTADFTTGDAVLLNRAAIGDGDVAFTASAALAWLRAMLHPALPAEMLAPAALKQGAPVPYGCGLFLDSVDGCRIAHHAGHFDGWTAMMYLNLDRGAGVFALCDLAPGSTRAIRGIAQAALEAFAPGTTPLCLAPTDTDRAETRAVLAPLFRGDAAPDLSRFAPSMHPGPGTRGLMSFGPAEAIADIELVERYAQPGREMRRYRIRREEQAEHLLLGIDDAGRIDWAWPL